MKKSLFVCMFLWLFACGSSNQTTVKPGPKTPGTSYFGVWFSPQYGRMQICTSEGKAFGYYTKEDRDGKIEGFIRGDMLRFDWTETVERMVGKPTYFRGKGYFKLSRGDDDRQYIQGEWGSGEAQIGGGPWNAVKLEKEAAEKCLTDKEVKDMQKGEFDTSVDIDGYLLDEDEIEEGTED